MVNAINRYLMTSVTCNLSALVVCIGILLKGDTDHYEFLMDAVGGGLMQAQLRSDVPIVNGVLTCRTEAQIVERAVTNNLGVSFANAAVALVA